MHVKLLMKITKNCSVQYKNVMHVHHLNFLFLLHAHYWVLESWLPCQHHDIPYKGAAQQQTAVSALGCIDHSRSVWLNFSTMVA